METKEISDEKINSEIIRDTSDSNSSLIHLEEVNEIIINNKKRNYLYNIVYYLDTF